MNKLNLPSLKHSNRGLQPEALPGFPTEYLDDPSKQVAARMYADELVFYRRMGDVVQNTLERLVAEFESGMTLPSSSAAQAKAIGDMIDRMAKFRDRMADLTAPDPSQAAENLLGKLNALTRELRTMRSSRMRAMKAAVAVEAEVVQSTATGSGSGPDKAGDPSKSLPSNET